MTWEQLSSAFSSQMRGLYDQTIGQLAAAIEASPQAFEARVTEFFNVLAQTRAHLVRIQTLLPNPPRNAEEGTWIARYAEMKAMYDALVQGLRQAGATNANALEIGNPVVLAVVGIGLTVAAIAWAVSAYQYAVGLRDQTAFMAQELEARVESMRTNKPLPPVTATPPSAPAEAPASAPPPNAKSGGWGWLVAGLGLAAGAYFFIPKLGKG